MFHIFPTFQIGNIHIFLPFREFRTLRIPTYSGGLAVGHDHLRKARHCSRDPALATRDGLRAAFDDRRTWTHHHRPAPAPDQALAARMLRQRFATSSGSRPSQGSGTGRCRLGISRPTVERVDTAARRLIARLRVVYVGEARKPRGNSELPP